MESVDFEAALAALSEGYSEGISEPTMDDATACLRENWQEQTLSVST
jgi:hypothetical protein